MRKTGIFAASLLMASTWAMPALADTITFDTNGPGANVAGTVVTIDLMDPTTGNSFTTVNAAAGTARIQFQANLFGTSLDGNSNFFACFAGSTCFTFTAVADVVITSVDSGGNPTFALNTAPGSLNNFYMYANPTQQGTNLSGQCFAAADGCGGVLIASGHFTTFESSPVFTNPSPSELLDQFGADNYGLHTVTGGGEFSGNILIDSHLSAWFPDLVDGTSFFLASSEQSLPFKQANPSKCFSPDGLTNPNAATCNDIAGVGPVNGLSTNKTITQTDSNVSFLQPQTAVPEPMSLVLLGTGLVGLAARRRRVAKN